MAKGNKRQRKKQAKRQILINNPGINKKLSYKELLSIENERKKKELKSQRKREKEARWLSFLQEEANRIGYKGKVYKSWSLDRLNEEFKKQQKQQKKKQRADAKKARIKKKYDYLRENGLDARTARTLAGKDFSWDKLKQYIEGDNKIYYTGDRKNGPWLAVCWADRTGESDLRGAYRECQTLSLQEKINWIHELYDTAVADPDDSDNLSGFAYVIIEENRRDMEEQIKIAQTIRGYGQSVNYNFVKLAGSNCFTVTGYADILYVIMTNTCGLHAKRTYEKLEEFSAEYLKKIYERIF